MVNNVIILAGGAGKRLWPASLNRTPKQFMRVVNDSSLFRGSMDRALRLGIDGCIYVVTHVDHLETALQECSHLSYEWRERVIFLAEPVARNTAPALTLAAAVMESAGRMGETALVMAADHLIEPQESFNKSVELASQEAQNGHIAVYGIVPTTPSTGYGYIETGVSSAKANEVLSFREKPDADTAKNYLASGNYYWNSGLFTWRNDVFLTEMNRHAPEIAASFADPDESWFIRQNESGISVYMPSDILTQHYKNCPSNSVDYALMEKTRNIRMVKAIFQWNDVGSWDVIAEINPPPQKPVYSIQSSNNFVYSEIPVALCKVENLIVVVANNRVMICRKGCSQYVKEATELDSVHNEESKNQFQK